MGFFDSPKYSTVEHYLTEVEVKHHLTIVAVTTLKEVERNLIQTEILARRHGDGKISLQQIWEVLNHLKQTNKISVQDRDGAMKVMEELFEKKV